MGAGENNHAGPSNLARRRSGSLGRNNGGGSKIGEDSETFVPGHSSDSESDGGESDDEASTRKADDERRKKFLMLGSTAGVSRADLRPKIQMFGDDYGDAEEEADEEATLVGDRRAGDEEEGSEEGNVVVNQSGGLSDKAGIILVRLFSLFFDTLMNDFTNREYTTSSSLYPNSL